MSSQGNINICFVNKITRMTTFLKAKLKKSDGQMNIAKYRVVAHKILLNIISEQKLDLLRHLKT